LERRLLR
jgi:hypothetical protein